MVDITSTSSATVSIAVTVTVQYSTGEFFFRALYFFWVNILEVLSFEYILYPRHRDAMKVRQRKEKTREIPPMTRGIPLRYTVVKYMLYLAYSISHPLPGFISRNSPFARVKDTAQ